MTRFREAHLLLRQLTAHDWFLVRRGAREAAAAVLAWLGQRLPGSAELALRLHPNSRSAHAALVARASRHGDQASECRHRAALRDLQRNTLETPVLATLARTLRRPRAALPASREMGVGARVDALLRGARQHDEAGRGDEARALAEEAHALDAGRADAAFLVGRLALHAGDAREAARALESALDLEPRDAGGWLDLGDALKITEPERARTAWKRVLALDPRRDSAVLRLEPHSIRRPSRPGLLTLAPARLDLEVDESTTLHISVAPGSRALYILPSLGSGVRCDPAGRIALGTEAEHVDVQVTATRSTAANEGSPWPLSCILVSDTGLSRMHCAVQVPDREPGRIHFLVTEDHELYDERERITPDLAETTLIAKSRLAEEIANRAGVRWTHVVDVGSLDLVRWAAEQSPGERWQGVAAGADEHLIDAVERGNDLALHCHAFHDPETDAFCHDFDTERDEITTAPEFLATPAPERLFWSRAFPRLGHVDDVGSRAWALWRGIGRLEGLGRLGDPHFRVTLFRAGSYDFGDSAAEREGSLSVLSRLGILADSDVPKPRLYRNAPKRSAHPVRRDPHEPCPPDEMRVLEIRPEYNVEGDFLSDGPLMNDYVRARLEQFRTENGSIEPGRHFLCAMTHDKFINWRMGRQWDSLDPDYGDWATIRRHLEDLVRRHPELRCVSAREAILDWYEHCATQPVAWRDEEIVVVAAQDEANERFRYTIRLLGGDLAPAAGIPQSLRVHLPAWAHGRIREASVTRGGAPTASRWLRELAALEFEPDTRDARWELTVVTEPGGGIRAERSSDDGLSVVSRLSYRRATVEIPGPLTPGGQTLRVRNVRLSREGDLYRGFIAWPR